MKHLASMFAVGLMAFALSAQAAKPVVVELAYTGQGHYVFKKKTYDHQAVVQAIQAKYQGEHIDLVSVRVAAGASVAERRDICQLRVELGTRLKMHVEVGDGSDTTQPQFCN